MLKKRISEGNEFHDEKNFSKFLKEMQARFPKLKEQTSEQPAEKNEIINLEKANEVFKAVMGARDEDEPIVNNSTVVFGMITERLQKFPLNSAKCKKVYDKYFKKQPALEPEKKQEVETTLEGLFEAINRIKSKCGGELCSSLGETFTRLISQHAEWNKNFENKEKGVSRVIGASDQATNALRTTRQKQPVSTPTPSTKEKKKPSDADTMHEEFPSLGQLSQEMKECIESSHIMEVINQRIELIKQQPDLLEMQKQQMNAENLTFGYHASREEAAKNEKFVVPPLDKFQSMIVDSAFTPPNEEQKDIPFLRAYSEQAQLVHESPIHSGGFSLSKQKSFKGSGFQPVAGQETPRLDNRLGKQLLFTKTVEIEANKPPDDFDIGELAKSLARELEG